jgi:thiamine kinase-like enzyme
VNVEQWIAVSVYQSSLRLSPMTEKLSRQIESAHNLDNRHKSVLIQKMDKMTFENRLCHGDYHLFNLIMSDDNVTIIDWVDSSAGDIRADVYRTYLLYSQFSIELVHICVFTVRKAVC